MSKGMLALMLALIAAAPAAAAPWGVGPRRGMEPQRGGYPPAQPMPWREPPPPDRRLQRDDQRPPPGSALTEEERQALRRDLDKASRELYRRRR